MISQVEGEEMASGDDGCGKRWVRWVRQERWWQEEEDVAPYAWVSGRHGDPS